MPATVTLRADQTPAPQVSTALRLLSDAYASAAGTAPAAQNFAPGQSGVVPHKLNENALRGDLATRYGGSPVRGIAAGLAITATALTATVAAGHAIIDGIVEVPAAHGGIGLSNNSWNYLWLHQNGAITVQANTLSPPAADCVYLGAVHTVGGVPSSPATADTSGVFYVKGGMALRFTADADMPADAPPAGVALYTKTVGGLWLWDTASYQRAGVAGGTYFFGTLDYDATHAVKHDDWQPDGGRHVTDDDRLSWEGAAAQVDDALTETSVAPFAGAVRANLLAALNSIRGFISTLYGRNIATSGGITGGGTLSADRTLSLDGYGAAADGEVPQKNASGGLDWGAPTFTGLDAGSTGLNFSESAPGHYTLSGALNIASGGTGGTTAAQARFALGLGSAATRNTPATPTAAASSAEVVLGADPRLAATGVTPGNYGDDTHIPEVTVNQYGNITGVVLHPVSSGGSTAFDRLTAANIATVDCGGAPAEVRLPGAGGQGDWPNALTPINNTIILVKKTDGTGNALTVQTAYTSSPSPAFEDGETQHDITEPYGWLMLQFFDGAGTPTDARWRVIGRSTPRARFAITEAALTPTGAGTTYPAWIVPWGEDGVAVKTFRFARLTFQVATAPSGGSATLDVYKNGVSILSATVSNTVANTPQTVTSFATVTCQSGDIISWRCVAQNGSDGWMIGLQASEQ